MAVVGPNENVLVPAEKLRINLKKVSSKGKVSDISALHGSTQRSFYESDCVK